MLFEVKDSADKRLKREKSWQGILIHHTAGASEKNISSARWEQIFNNMVSWLTKKDKSYLSAHYIISRSGKIVQAVNPDTHEAFHAGVSTHWHPALRKRSSDCNRFLIGIEVVGDGNVHSYSDEQYSALINLCRYLISRYETISPLCITGHENVATPDGRKNDPGKLFDWKRLFKGIYS